MANHFPKISLLNLDWNDLKFFLAVARGGSLTQAAESLDASPSTVSRHIDALEKKLGVTLFLRSQSGYLLSDQGQDMLEPIVAVEQSMMSVERRGHTGDVAQTLSGKVRLATSEGLAAYLVAPQLPEFRRRYPRVQVELVVGVAMVDLHRREADLALRFVNPADQVDGQDFIGIHLGEVRFSAYCSRQLLGNRQPDMLKLADELECIAWSDDTQPMPITAWTRKLFGNKAPLMSSNNMLVQHHAARAGLGIVVLPDYMGETDRDLVRLTVPDHLPMWLNLWVVYHRDLKRSQRVMAMRDFLKDVLKRHLRSQQ